MTQPNRTKYPGVCTHCGAPFLGYRRGQRHCSRQCRGASERHPVAERFWAKVHKTEGCWPWTHSTSKHGYGLFLVVKHHRVEMAHRMAWELTYGPVPDGLYVCHRCDNPPCVRPDHLFLGTHADNMADMASKGRRANFQGERNGGSHLTDDAVREMRAMLAAGVLSQRRIAERFGVTQGVVSRINTGKSWRHI